MADRSRGRQPEKGVEREGLRWKASRLLSICLVMALLAMLTMALAACTGRAESFQGTAFNPGRVAAPFELTDHLGQRVALSDFRGKVVLLTFLYTQCPDVCPITTSQLRQSYDLLGKDAGRVGIVAISVDPARDSVEAARSYSDRWEMTDKWSYLVGAEEELRPIWKSYYIDPAYIEHAAQGDAAHQEEGQARQQAGVRGLGQAVIDKYLVIHSAPVYVIDKEGVMRVVFTLPFEPKDLAHDVRLLLK